MADLLPTPVVMDARGARNRTAGRRPDSTAHIGDTLTDAVWLLPTPAAADGERTSATYERGNPTLTGALLPTPQARDGDSRGASHPDRRKELCAKRAGQLDEVAVHLLPTPNATDAQGGPRAIGDDGRTTGDHGPRLRDVAAEPNRWGRYATAVARWEAVIGRPAPDPTEPGTKGQPRLAPRFVEWMQGLDDGWVTSVPGVSRSGQLRLLGNGVVPQQQAAALRLLLGDACPEVSHAAQG